MERSVTAARHDVELEQLRGERDRYRGLAEERDETIRDLRARLDSQVEERRRLTLLLSPPATVPDPPPPPQRPLGRRILAWLARQHGW